MLVPSTKLVLTPSASLASPHGWTEIARASFNPLQRFDEVHCVDGGSLLLFLLCRAGKAPRLSSRGKVFFHGPVVLPTAASCTDWLARIGAKGTDGTDEWAWRKEALSLGMNGNLHEDKYEWLQPITRSIASGRSAELVAHFKQLQHKSEQKGRLIHLGRSASTTTSSSQVVLRTLCEVEEEAPCLFVHSGGDLVSDGCPLLSP